MTIPARTLKEHSKKKSIARKVSNLLMTLGLALILACIGLTGGTFWYQYYYLDQIYSKADIHKNLPQKWAGGLFRVEALDNGNKNYGTGFLIGPQIVLTNAHVVGSAKTVRLCTDAMRENLLGAVIWAGAYKDDPLQDLAVINLGDQNSRPADQILLQTLKPIEVMDSIVALGFNLGRNNLSYLTGNITSLSRDDGLIQYDAAVNRGCSGGPLISLNDKKVVGMVVMMELATDGKGAATQLAIPMAKIMANLPKNYHSYIKLPD